MYPKTITITKKTPKDTPDEIVGQCSIQWADTVAELTDYYGDEAVVDMVKAALNIGFRGKIRQLHKQGKSFDDIQIFIHDKKWCPPGRPVALTALDTLLANWNKASNETKTEFTSVLRSQHLAAEEAKATAPTTDPP